MSILDYIFSRIPDNSTKKITAKDLRDSFEKVNQRIDEVITSAYLGIATTTTSPPATGAYWYRVDTTGTYTNFLSGGSPVVVSAGDLDGNEVFIEVKDNVATKRVMAIPMPPVTGVVEEGNANAVSGGEVKKEFDKITNKGKNRYNPETRVVGKYLLQSTGAPTIDNPSIDTTAKIKIQGNKITISGSGNASKYRAICFYNSSGVYLPSLTIQATNSPELSYTIDLTEAISNGADSFAVSFANAVTNYQIEFGEIATPYTPFVEMKIKPEVLPALPIADGSVITSKIADEAILEDKTVFFEQGKNLLNLNDPNFLDGFFIGTSTSNIPIVNTVYFTTGWIKLPVPEDGKKIYLSSSVTGVLGRYVQFYTDTTLESRIPSLMLENSNSFEIPTTLGAKFFRITYAKAREDFQIEFNTQVTSYEPFGAKLKKKYLPSDTPSPIVEDIFELFLPKEVCIAVGRTIELYNSQVAWCGNINDYHFLWSGVGKCMKRKWTMEGVTIGNNTLRCRVYDKNNVLIADKSTTVKVVSNVMANNVDITCIGDSLSNNKPWFNEIKNLSSNNISFIGTRGESSIGYKHEGRSGALSSYYLENKSYTFDANGIAGNDGRTQDLNPFWNPATQDVDFNYYKSNYNQNPDVLTIWLGTNGISVNPETNAGNVKTFIDKIRVTGGESIKIFVVLTLFRANQNGIGKQTGTDGYVANTAYKLEEDLKVFNLQVKLNDLLKDYANVFLIPVSTCHDSEYNFGNVETKVNPRSEQVTYMPVEATHPQLQGYLQIADVIFSSYCANL